MAHGKLSPSEIVDTVQLVYNALKLLTEKDALAAIILTYDSYEPVRNLFGPSCKPYAPSGVCLDPLMENSFVLDGLLVLRGTDLQ